MEFNSKTWVKKREGIEKLANAKKLHFLSNPHGGQFFNVVPFFDSDFSYDEISIF